MELEQTLTRGEDVEVFIPVLEQDEQKTIANTSTNMEEKLNTQSDKENVFGKSDGTGLVVSKPNKEYSDLLKDVIDDEKEEEEEEDFVKSFIDKNDIIDIQKQNALAASYFWDHYARHSHIHNQTYSFSSSASIEDKSASEISGTRTSRAAALKSKIAISKQYSNVSFASRTESEEITEKDSLNNISSKDNLESIPKNYDNFAERLKISRERWRTSIFEVISLKFPLPPSQLIKASCGRLINIPQITKSNDLNYIATTSTVDIPITVPEDENILRLDYELHVKKRESYKKSTGESIEYLSTADLCVGPFTFPGIPFFKLIVPKPIKEEPIKEVKDTLEEKTNDIIGTETSEINNINENHSNLQPTFNTLSDFNVHTELHLETHSETLSIPPKMQPSEPKMLPNPSKPTTTNTTEIERNEIKGNSVDESTFHQSSSPPLAGINRLSSLILSTKDKDKDTTVIKAENNTLSSSSSISSQLSTFSKKRSRVTASSKKEKIFVVMFLGGEYRILPTDGILENNLLCTYLPTNTKVHNQQGVLLKLENILNEEIFNQALSEAVPADMYGQVRKFRLRMMNALPGSKTSSFFTNKPTDYKLSGDVALSKKWLNDPKFKLEDSRIYAVKKKRKPNKINEVKVESNDAMKPNSTDSKENDQHGIVNENINDLNENINKFSTENNPETEGDMHKDTELDDNTRKINAALLASELLTKEPLNTDMLTSNAEITSIPISQDSELPTEAIELEKSKNKIPIKPKIVKSKSSFKSPTKGNVPIVKLLPKAEPGTECSGCGAKSTPLWRKGPYGSKTLCNACGVRYMQNKVKFVQ